MSAGALGMRATPAKLDCLGKLDSFARNSASSAIFALGIVRVCPQLSSTDFCSAGSGSKRSLYGGKVIGDDRPATLQTRRESIASVETL